MGGGHLEWGKPQGARAINVSFNHRPYINPWTGEPKAETRPEKKPEWSASMDSGEPSTAHAEAVALFPGFDKLLSP